MEGPQTPFTSLLIQKTDPDLHDYHHAVSSLEKYRDVLQDAMQDETLHDQIVLHPTRTLTRLHKVFDILKTKKLTISTAVEVFTSLVLRFVSSSEVAFSQAQSIALLASALPFIIQSSPQCLEVVASMMLSQEGMFEQLAADENYCPILKTWLLAKRTHLDSQLIRQITERLFSMCDACSADHGVRSASERWSTAKDLMESLKDQIHTVEEEHEMSKQKENIPPIEAMKALNVDDKKSNQAGPDRQKKFKLPANIEVKIVHLDLPKIQSASGLSRALEHLQDELTPEVMRLVLESYPCRLCLERMTGAESTFVDHSHRKSDEPLDSNIAEIDIFGKRVGVWKVLLSEGALTSIKKLARTSAFGCLEEKLRILASGKWKGNDLSRQTGSKKQKQQMHVPILQAKVTEDVSILWQIDVGFYDELPWVQQQILKVWGITTSAQESDASIEQIIIFQDHYCPEIIQLCVQRPEQQPNGTFIPKQFGRAQKGFSHMQPILTTVEDHVVIETSNKFFNLTEPFLKSISQATGQEEFPFDLAPEEKDIVAHFTTSTLILGRSGTGKTTCLVFKLLARQRARQANLDGKSTRQLLLTRSPYLASKIQSYARNLIATHAGTLKVQGSPTVEKSSTIGSSVSFLALKDKEYPFICTYDEFLDLLESTFRRADRQDFLETASIVKNSNPKKKNTDLQSLEKPKLVDFHIFKTEYWGALSGIVPSGCSPELLFAEIMGVIKGSAVSAKTLEPLGRRDYLAKSSKASPSFVSEAERPKVFDAFERYERIKKTRGQIDELDRVTSFLKVLQNSPALAEVIQQCFEEIYVDEIQDLRCLDIVLLLSCLCDARGMHLAGDTAQCISRDSAFRFPEIKALFYDYYEVIAKKLNQPSIAKPVQFTLARNYRSHQGILSFATWVMQLLWTGFPETVDKLDPEVGETGGPRPILFAGFDASVLSAKMIGLVKLNDQVAEFGAEQVILVRDDASKDKLQAQIGEIALVLTIAESKGMEFDDVLVYNFFGEGGHGSSYRCLTLLAQGLRAQFNPQKHAALCSELKHLYVAVTRARRKLWFMETSENSVDPVLQALSQSDNLQLAEIVKQKDHNVADKVKVLRAGGSVDPERWLKRAAHLLRQKNFADALFCFKKADDPLGVIHAQAWIHEQEGRTFRAANNLEAFTECFEKAISLFLELDHWSEAADCFQELGRYEKAAELWKNQGQLEKAAAFYEKGGLFADAASCHHSQGEYEHAAEVLRRGDQFDQLIHYINQNRGLLNSNAFHRYSRLCNILLKQGRIPLELREVTINLLGSDTAKIAFFKEYEMFDQLRDFYKRTQKWVDYYETLATVGDLYMAMATLLEHDILPTIDKNVAETILHYSTAEVIFQTRDLIHKNPGQTMDLLEHARSTPLEESVLQWSLIFDIMNHFISNSDEALPLFQSMEGGFIKDFFSLFHVAFETKLLNTLTSSVTQLHIEILGCAGKVIQMLESQDAQSLQTLSLLVGLFTHPDPGSPTILLHWSPLKSFKASISEYASKDELLGLAKRWIRGKFTDAISRFDDCAKLLLRQWFPKVCESFITKGTCSRQRTGNCTWAHEIPRTDACCKRLNFLLDVAEVFSRLTTLYYQNVMPDHSFQKPFLGRRRRWLQLLIEEFIFVSSLEQSPTAIIKARQRLLNEEGLAATLSCLEELLFYRLRKEWYDIQQFSASAEQLQLAHFLGSDISERYNRRLNQKIRGILVRLSRDHFLQRNLGGLHAAESVRRAISVGTSKDLLLALKIFLNAIDVSDNDTVGHFHAVLSVVEYAATFNLCRINPGNAVVLPWSWAIQYLPSLMDGPVPQTSVVGEEERHHHYVILHTVLVIVCVIFKRKKNDIDSGNLTFKGMGRNQLSSVFPKRRLFDYITTCLLNLAYWPVQNENLAELWSHVSPMLCYVAPAGFAMPKLLTDLREPVVKQYEIYQDKDHLQIITLDDSQECPDHFKAFRVDDSPMDLSSLLVHSHWENEVSAVPGTSVFEPITDLEYSSFKIDMIIRLQRRWKRVMRVLQETRRMLATPEGKTLTALFKMVAAEFSAAPGTAQLPPSQKIRLRKLLFTDGVKILVDVDAAAATLRRAKVQLKARFRKAATIEIERLDVIQGAIAPIEKMMRKISQLWTVRGLKPVVTNISAKSLGEKAREAQRSLSIVKKELEAVQAQLEDRR